MPDFRMQQNSFPISSVIDAATRNAQLQQQAREQGNQSLIQGLQAIGGIGQSLYDQKVKVAQALAGAHMYANTPEGQQLLGTNQVANTAEGPVTQNQTASYDPSTGSVTPLKSPVDVRTIATAMYGMNPKDMMENMVQNRLASTQQGELALKQQTEPKRLAIEQQKNTIEQGIQSLLAGIRGKEAETGAKRAETQDINDLLARRSDLAKDLPTGMWSAFNNDKALAAQEGIKDIDAQLEAKGYKKAPTLTFLPNVGETVVHPSGVKITRKK